MTLRRVVWTAPGPAALIACIVWWSCPAGQAQAPAPALVAVGDEADQGPPRVELGPLGTIGRSLFAYNDPEDRWTPLPPRTFFTEGWREPWVRAPAGRDGLTPRHGWLNAFDGVIFPFSVVNVFGDISGLNPPVGGNRYTGTTSVFLPFTRRFELICTVPFVVSNGTTDPRRGYTSQFGDLTAIPRILLSEGKSSSQVLALAIRTPTGTHATANEFMALSPRHEFWTNPAGSWVLRGANGLFLPLNGSKTRGTSAIAGGLALGRYFRPHDVPFGDLVFYCETNYSVPLDGTAPRNTAVTAGPGFRFHIANNFFFLNNWDFPVTGARAADYSVLFAVLKIF